MNEDATLIIEDAEESMQKALIHLEREFQKIRAGKATPEMVDSVKVDYYGSDVPVSQVANINTPDARQITIQPWEKSMLAPIEKAIINANLGFTPQNNGELIRINLPVITEERRRDLVKMAKAEVENAKISIRGIRKSANDELKKSGKEGMPEDMVKDAESAVQDLTKKYGEKVDLLFNAKEVDIMTV